LIIPRKPTKQHQSQREDLKKDSPFFDSAIEFEYMLMSFRKTRRQDHSISTSQLKHI